MIMETIELLTPAGGPGRLLPFYRDVLGVPVLEFTERRLTVGIGYTVITFVSEGAESSEGRGGKAPYYHFAMNIPENKLDEAKRWIEARVELGMEGDRDISHSELWNSDAVYFMDSVGNILELIARHTMNNGVDRPFDPSIDLLGVSEMGLPTKDVLGAADVFESLGIPTYIRRDPMFNPVGDEEGLFILVPPGKIWAFSNGLTAECFPFTVSVKDFGLLTLEEGPDGLVVTRR
ncbi:VOC family protein [Paenibacillus soyae]|uniref:Ring-cleaving dioxygenase n=1 Tax=Paenibacillus soyae TaxID=2969249 RepID=A0A9X2MS44_9BACL|nr:ring-cleaving dioxygenase [Paenibacillus soyae]MCR2805262.1 ring-cleaving dioxygenase [Paenibacillus soyae]